MGAATSTHASALRHVVRNRPTMTSTTGKGVMFQRAYLANIPLSVGDSAVVDYDRTSSFSGAALIAHNSDTAAVAIHTIFGKQLGASTYQGWSFGLLSTFGVSHYLRFEITADATHSLVMRGGTSIVTGTVTHVAFSYDGSGTPAGVKLYVNGVLETNTTITNTLASGTVSGQGAPFRVGARGGAAAVDAFNGGISDVAAWSSILTTGNFATLAALRATYSYTDNVSTSIVPNPSGRVKIILDDDHAADVDGVLDDAIAFGMHKAG